MSDRAHSVHREHLADKVIQTGPRWIQIRAMSTSFASRDQLLAEAEPMNVGVYVTDPLADKAD